MFDLDGTLTETMQADEACFVQALADVFGFKDVVTDWSAYRHATNGGILSELFETRRGRLPDAAEIKEFGNRFFTLLKQSTLENSHHFAPIPGAGAMLKELRGHDEFGLALATGGWKRTAQLKLEVAKLVFPFDGMAFADDHLSREGIMEQAAQRALQHCQQTQFESITYVGDGLWDVRAAKNLGYRFIGIGQGAKAERLRAAGATTIFPDYLKLDAFVEVLEAVGGRSKLVDNVRL